MLPESEHDFSIISRMKTKPKTKRKPASETASTIGDCAQILGVSPAWVKACSRAIGIRAPGGRIKVGVVRQWIAHHRERLESEGASLKDLKLAEQVRKLRFENDREESSLVRLDWVRERFSRVAGELHSIKDKALESHPVRFLEAHGDIASCRTILKQCWDENMRALQGCSHHFEEPPKT